MSTPASELQRLVYAAAFLLASICIGVGMIAGSFY